jgi:hypothetical protein
MEGLIKAEQHCALTVFHKIQKKQLGKDSALFIWV